MMIPAGFDDAAQGAAAAAYDRPFTGRGSSRGLAAYATGRVPLASRQHLAPSSNRIQQGLHRAEAQEAFYAPGWTTHSMRSTRNRGMAAIPRWPNTLPWAYNRVANAKELAGASTRLQPQRTSYMESPDTHGMGSMWLDGTLRESQPFMDINGRATANPLTRSRRKMPYTLDTRTYAVYDKDGSDTGINGIDRLLLHNHHLLPNTDERAQEYAEAQPPQYHPAASAEERAVLAGLTGRRGVAVQQQLDDVEALRRAP